MPKRDVPSTASFAETTPDGRLFAPSAARNAGPLGDLLADLAPARGSALELASGTGQHVAAFAARLPGLHWQPTEIDPARRTSIDAYLAEAGLANTAPAQDLDATRPGWGADHAGQALILLVNLLHLISAAEAQILITEAATALSPEGLFLVYGPFMRTGELTSEGDRTFHASLTAQDGEIGYKDDGEIIAMMQAAGLDLVRVVEMPANNLALVARRP